ncbi:MAG: hypothetical protein V1798_07725 [Pseudomonadota bacterium]
MFILDEEFQGFSNPEEKVLSVFQSINEPKVAAAERPAEPAQACIVIGRDGIELEIHVVLHLKSSGVFVGYSWDEGPFSSSQRPGMEGEALDFVESMGFMMNNLSVEKMTPEQKKEVFGEMSVFGAWPKADAATREPELDEEAEKPTRAEFGIGVSKGAAPEVVPELESLLSSSYAGGTSREPAATAPRMSPHPRPKVEPVEVSDEEFQREETDFRDELDSIAKLLDAQEEGPEMPGEMPRAEALKSPEPPVQALLRWFASF